MPRSRWFQYLPIVLVIALAMGPVPAHAGWPPLMRSGILFPEGQWPAGSPVRTGSPYSLAAGDFNGDGLVDLVAGNTLGGGSNGELGVSVSVLLHTSSPSFPAMFQGWNNSTVAQNPTDIAVADMNHDGKLDIVVNSIWYPRDTVSVLLGTGTSFRPGKRYGGLRAGDGWILVDDFNGDGLPDLAASDSAATAVMLAVNPDSLGPPVDYMPGGWPAAFADITGDGNRDLVTVRGAAGGTSVFVTVYPGNGTGTFATPPISVSVPGGERVAVASLNGDAFLDLVAACPAGSVKVLFGTGGGAFGPPISIPVGNQPDQVVTGDMDQDGDVDIVSAPWGTRIMSNGVMLLRNDGNGTFTTSAYSGLPFSGKMLLADVDQDGRLDAVAPTWDAYNEPNTHTIGALLNDGAGGLRGSRGSSLTGQSIAEAVGDFDGDGKPDVAAADSSEIVIGLGNLTGTFARGPTLSVASKPSTVLAKDVNGNGTADLLVQFSTQVNVYQGAGNGAFALTSSFNGKLFRRSLADVDGDGKPDVVGGSGGQLIVLHNSGGSFVLAAGPVPVSPGMNGLCVGDWNGDGKTDVAVAGPNGLSLVLGPFFDSASERVVITGRYYTDACAGDFNRDGLLDLAARQATTSDETFRGIDVFLGTGSGSFNGPESFGTMEVSGATIDTWDANRDGLLDLVASGASSSYPTPTEVDLFLGDGEGRFGLRTSYAVGVLNRSSGQNRPITVGDVNLDGTPDVLAGAYTADFFTNPVSLQVILSSPPTPPTSGVAEVASVFPKPRLAQNAPNPFNPSTTIRFALQNRDHVRLSVYSASGRLVSVLENSDLDAGSHSISWNGLDREGHAVGSGVYVYRLVTGSGFRDSKRMVLVR